MLYQSFLELSSFLSPDDCVRLAFALRVALRCVDEELDLDDVELDLDDEELDLDDVELDLNDALLCALCLLFWAFTVLALLRRLILLLLVFSTVCSSLSF